MPSYDLAIIGGGPAGTAAAFTAARRGASVALLDKGEFPRDKVCGEFFSPEAEPLLREMAPELAAAAPEIATAVFVSPTGRGFSFALPQPARGISRWALDAALWQAAGKSGATLRPRATVTAVTTLPTGVHIMLADGPLEARALIVATGRWWRIPGLAAPTAARRSPWIGVKARFQGLPQTASVELHFFRGGYCGIAPVENGWTNACCLIHRQRAGELTGNRDFAQWISAIHPPLADRLAGATQATPTVTTAPVAMGPRASASGPALRAGDASGFIDPFTGDGLARAMLSGQLAATACLDRPTTRFEAYHQALIQATATSFRASALARALLQSPPWLQSLALATLLRPPAARRGFAATRWRAI